MGSQGQADWAILIAAIAQRADRSAFRSLFDHFAPRIKTYMRRSGLDDSAAEELAQEAMLMVWRKAALFDPATAGSAAWIFTIARNLRIDALRRDRRSPAVVAGLAEAEFILDPAPLPDAAAATMQDQHKVRHAMSKLNPDQQRVLELSFFHEAPHGEIARVLGIPLGTVKSRLRLAMVRLRGLLEGGI